MTEQNSRLIKYDAACHALAEARAFDEVKDWSDKAAAMQEYAKQAKNKGLEVDAAEIRIRAERRLGELIAEQKVTKGLAKPGRKSLLSEEGNKTPKLSDAGISYNLSSRAQKLASVPADEFEAEVSEWRERVEGENARVSARLEAAGYRQAKKEEAPPEQEYDADEGDIDPVAQMAADLEEALEDNKRMGAIFDADDRLAAAVAEVDRLTALAKIHEQSIARLTNECNQAKRAAKSWMNKFKKMEKEVGRGISADDFEEA
jgi:hypothetical protein